MGSFIKWSKINTTMQGRKKGPVQLEILKVIRKLDSLFLTCCISLCRVWPDQEASPLWGHTFWVWGMAASGGSGRPDPPESCHHQEQTLRELPGGPERPLCRTDIIQWRLQMVFRVGGVTSKLRRRLPDFKDAFRNEGFAKLEQRGTNKHC